jgi:hypothetical protein
LAGKRFLLATIASGGGGVGRVRTALWILIGVYAVKGSTGSLGGVIVLVMFSSTGDGHLKKREN